MSNKHKSLNLEIIPLISEQGSQGYEIQRQHSIEDKSIEFLSDAIRIWSTDFTLKC